MNIISKLKNNNLNFNIKYYGLEDMSTGITVRHLLDGKELILNHYSDYSINDVNQYIDYVFLEYIIKFNEVIPYVMEEKQEEFKDFMDNCNLMFKKYEIKNVILYLKSHYLDVYEYKNDDSKISKNIIFDLKKGGFAIKEKEMMQAFSYVNALKYSGSFPADVKITSYVVGNTIEPKMSDTLESDKDNIAIYATTYRQLVATAHKRMFSLREYLQERYDNMETENIVNKVLKEPKQGTLELDK